MSITVQDVESLIVSIQEEWKNRRPGRPSFLKFTLEKAANKDLYLLHCEREVRETKNPVEKGKLQTVTLETVKSLVIDKPCNLFGVYMFLNGFRSCYSGEKARCKNECA